MLRDGFWPLFAAVLVAGCGSADRVAGGTNGTEAGNAVTARLVLPDGSPASGARAVFRPGDALDSTGAASWVVARADSLGAVSARLAPGSWTLEASGDGLAVRRDFRLDSTLSVLDTLRAPRTLSGWWPGGTAGARIYLPGLARSALLTADGRFQFDSVPAGVEPLVAAGLSWTASASDSSGLLLASANRTYEKARPLALEPVALLERWVPDPGGAWPNPIALLDSSGADVPTAQGTSRVWIGPSSRGTAFAASIGDHGARSPFQAARADVAWIPDLGDTTGIVRAPGSFLESDSAEGLVAGAILGGRVGDLLPGRLSGSGEFSLLVRARAAVEGVGSLQLVEWTDSISGEGLSLGIGSGYLSLRVGSTDTMVELPHEQGWHWYSASWRSDSLTVWLDGTTAIAIPTQVPAQRSTWNRLRMGQGGAVRIGAFLAWNRAVDVASVRDRARP